MLRIVNATLASLALAAGAFADEWFIETADAAGDVGTYTSLALDASGNPHISYRDDTNDTLKYAYYDGSSWQIETVDATGNVGIWTSIALDTSDNPHILYSELYPVEDLKYAYHDGSSWQIETVDATGAVGYYASITLDASDKPHISYYDDTNDDLKYAYHDGSSWQIESVDTAGYVGAHTSIALDSSDNAHISYYEDYPNYDLKYAYYDGTGWQIETVDTTGYMGFYTSIGLDATDNPHISYYNDSPNYDLKYAYYDGSSWQIESVDTTGYVGYYTSLALDTYDNPHISYYDDSPNYDLKYAYYDGSSWQIETVDSEEFVGFYTSIELDASDNPHISYYDITNTDLKYAWRNGPPLDFELLSPGNGETVADAPTLDWEDALDAQEVNYDLWYSEDTDFDPHEEVIDLADSAYSFGEGDLTDGTTYYWKVRAYDTYDEETWSGPDEYWSFDVDYELDIRVTSFSAESDRDGVEVSWECADAVSGFNLYRSVKPDETDAKAITSRNKLNSEMITGASPYKYVDTAVEKDITYSYWLEAIDVSGASETFGPAECTWSGVPPTTYALYQSRPNPASGTATIAFDLPEDVEVTLTVYDISGRKVTTLVNETLAAGEHAAEVSGLAPGVYLYKLDAGSFNATRKMVVVD
jgi:hypothetical protein